RIGERCDRTSRPRPGPSRRRWADSRHSIIAEATAAWPGPEAPQAHLAQPGPRQGADDQQLAGRPVASQDGPDPVAQLRQGRRGVRIPGHDRRHHAPAPGGVGPSEHGTVGDARMAAQTRLDVSRPDLLAAAHDEVVEPAADPKTPPVVDPAGISGAEPAVGGEVALFGRRLVAGVAVTVSAHQRRASQLDLARVARPYGHPRQWQTIVDDPAAA